MRFTATLVIALALVAGCSRGDRPELAPVCGTVTLDGKPLERATVVFQPGEGKSSRGVTDKQGRYELIYLRDIMGAKPGKHTVGITTADGETVVDETLPARYNRETELAAQVDPGGATIDFPLQSD